MKRIAGGARCGFILIGWAVAARSQAAPKALVLIPELRIDGRAQRLSSIGWIGVAPSGAIVVTQPVSHNARLFDAGGKAIGAVGREGDRTGGFLSIDGGGWLADTVWLADSRLRRVTLFSPEQRVLRVNSLPDVILLPSGVPVPIPSIGGMPPTVLPLALGTDGTFVTEVPIASAIGMPREWRPPVLPALAYLRIRSNGVSRGIAAWMPVGGAPCVRVTDVRIPFCPRPIHAIAPNGSALAFAYAVTSGPDSGRFFATVMAMNGDTVFSLSQPYMAIPVSKHDADSVRVTIPERLRRVSIQVANRVSAAIKANPPTIYPPILALLLGSDGTLWVERRSDRAERSWLILGARGEVVGSVAVPGNTQLRAVSRTVAWGIERDPSGGENVVRFRVVP